MNKINLLIEKTVEYFSGDPKRIQHFLKVHSLARLIAGEEGADAQLLYITEAAAVVHDIGIKNAELKFGSCSGKLQELEGPPEAEKMLKSIGESEAVIERVCYLVAHHHTYDSVNGLDYQALVEADFLVNLYEDGAAAAAAEAALKNIFKTKTGIRLCKAMFGLG